MSFRLHVIAPLLAVALAAPAFADDSGDFIITLGQDTTSVEHYTRTASRVDIHQVGRAPRVLERHFSYDYTKGEISAFSMVVTPPASTTPTQTINATFGPDSARIKIQSASAPAQFVSVAFPPGTLVLTGSSPWASYEGLLMKFVKEKRDSLRTTMYVVGGTDIYWLSLHRLGRDSVALINQRQDQFHVRVDKDGRLLGVLPIAGTGKVGVRRVTNLDVPAMAASFAAREQAGSGMGILSPRDSVVTTIAGASLWIDYGRPGKRGRVIFGDVVPYGEVWRTGANAATQFRTDKALDFGGMVVPAGFYTLWTVPSPGGWKLLINGETGQWGTAHKPDRDLFTIDMKVGVLSPVVERFTIDVAASAQGGVLTMDWDTTRVSAAFTVQP